MSRKHHWRDVGGGNVRCEKTGQVMCWQDLWNNSGWRKIELTAEEWSKLETLAKRRKLTPRRCLADLIKTSGGGSWQHPSKV